MKRQQVGTVFSLIRKEAKISCKHLCDGLCSEKTLRRIEKNDTRIDKWLFETLFSRMGKTTFQFEYYMNQNDYELQEMRHRIYQAVCTDDLEWLMLLLGKYESQKGTDGILHRQFILFMKSFLYRGGNKQREKIQQIEQALLCTMPKFIDRKFDEMYLSIEEINIISYLANAYEEAENNAYAFKLRKYCLDYLCQERIDDEIRLIFLPYLALRIAEQLCLQKNFLYLKELSVKMINLLTNRGELFSLSEMMIYQVKAMKKESDSDESSFYRSEVVKANMLSDLMKEYEQLKKFDEQHLLPERYQFVIMQRKQSECHLIGKDILAIRKAKIKTRAEVCEDICSIDTLYMIEKGKSTPQEKIYLALLKRMEVSDIFYERYVNASNFSTDNKRFRIERCLGRMEFKEARKLFQELKMELTEEKVDCQYRILIQTILDVYLYQLEPEKALLQLEEALSYSLPNYQTQDLQSWCLTRNEVKLLNSIADMYGQMNLVEEAIHILSKVKNNYETNSIDIRYHIYEYELILSHLGELFGLEKKYEEAIRIADRIIHLSLIWGTGIFLGMALYSKAKNLEQIIDERTKDKDKKICQTFFKQAFCIASVMNCSMLAEHCARHYKEKYKEPLLL